MNKTILTGRCGKDPEVEYLPGGTCKARFPLATSEYWNDKDGQKKEKTTWHNITAWNKKGELAEKYIRKGMLLSIIGKIENTSSEKDGVKRYYSGIILEEVEFLSSPVAASVVTTPAPGREFPDNFDETEQVPDDLPF